jgi:hypothetical protein
LDSTPITSLCPKDVFVTHVKNRLSCNARWWRILAHAGLRVVLADEDVVLICFTSSVVETGYEA